MRPICVYPASDRQIGPVSDAALSAAKRISEATGQPFDKALREEIERQADVRSAEDLGGRHHQAVAFFVYVAGPLDERCVKIGISQQPRGRLPHIYRMLRERRPVGLFFLFITDRPRTVEVYAHRILDKYALGHELFSVSADAAVEAIREATRLVAEAARTKAEAARTKANAPQPRRPAAEGEAILAHLGASLVECWDGERPIAELLREAAEHGERAREAAKVLAKLGLRRRRVETPTGIWDWTVVVANQSAGLSRLFRGTPWRGLSGASGAWRQPLLRLPGAFVPGNVMRFGDTTHRAVCVPETLAHAIALSQIPPEAAG